MHRTTTRAVTLLGAALLAATTMAAPASAPVIYSFNYMSDGQLPLGGLIGDGGRSLFGTTSRGGDGTGTAAQGTIYKLTPPLSSHGSYTEQILHTFPASSMDGTLPTGDLLQGPGGVLYGTTSGGGANGDGTVYSLARPTAGSSGAWTETILHAFTTAEGRFPVGGVIADPAGALYGVADGGAFNEGIVYRLVPPSPGQTQWTEQTLHSFNYAAGDGQVPVAPLVRDAAGNLYGITRYGGGRCDCGVAYELSPPQAGQTAWTETILHAFVPGADSYPAAGLVIDAGGTLFGTAAGGGIRVGSDYTGGVVYRLVPPAQPGAAWTYTPIFLFDGTDGGLPQARLTLTPEGDLYGTTGYGGLPSRACVGGCGTIFKLTHPAGGSPTWTETYVALPGRYAGRDLQADILIGPDQALYTTASEAGFKGEGSVLRVTPDMLQSVGTEP
jgi:uncharacterized repeat protein (TIGR03803 family)